jgi:hypothetical protein
MSSDEQPFEELPAWNKDETAEPPQPKRGILSKLPEIGALIMIIVLGVSLVTNGLLIARYMDAPNVAADLAAARAESSALRSELDYQRIRANDYADRLGLDYPGKAPAAPAAPSGEN